MAGRSLRFPRAVWAARLFGPVSCAAGAFASFTSGLLNLTGRAVVIGIGLGIGALAVVDHRSHPTTTVREEEPPR